MTSPSIGTKSFQPRVSKRVHVALVTSAVCVVNIGMDKRCGNDNLKLVSKLTICRFSLSSVEQIVSAVEGVTLHN